MPVRYHLLPQTERKNQSGKDVFYRLASHVSPLSSTVYPLTSHRFLALMIRLIKVLSSAKRPRGGGGGGPGRRGHLPNLQSIVPEDVQPELPGARPESEPARAGEIQDRD